MSGEQFVWEIKTSGPGLLSWKGGERKTERGVNGEEIHHAGDTSRDNPQSAFQLVSDSI